MLEDKKGPKINEKKLDETARILRQITQLIGEYEKLWKVLTPQEKALAGGIVFNLTSIWENFSLVGTLVEGPAGAALINQLANFFSQPRKQPIEMPSITPVEDKGRKTD